MKIKKGESEYDVETSRSFYLFLNKKWILATDTIKSLDNAKHYVVTTLCICGIKYNKEVSLYEGEDGYMHEVHEITTKEDITLRLKEKI